MCQEDGSRVRACVPGVCICDARRCVFVGRFSEDPAIDVWGGVYV
jgi:hypothetical protein